jgi:hypothetical protein
MDPNALPPEIQPRLTGPDTAPMPGTDQWPVNVPAQSLSPSQRPGGSYGDRLAMLLAGLQTPRPDTRTGQTNGIAAFLAGLAHGFSAVGLRDMQQRQDTQTSLNSAAVLQNKRQWDAAQQRERDRIGFLKTLSANSPQTLQAKARAGEAGKLEAQKAAGASPFGPTEPAANAAQLREMGLAPDQTATVKDYLRFKGGGTKGVFGQPGVDEVAKSIADGIESGTQAPVTTGLYRYGGPVRAELGRRGYDLQKAQLDFSATTRWLASANGPQQLRLRQAAETAYGSLDVIDQLSDQLSQAIPRGQVGVLNRAAMNLAKNGAFGVPAQQIATQLDAQITDVSSEISNVYMGGATPTDQSLKMAAKNLKGDWSHPQLKAATDLARKNLRIRLNSIGTAGPISPSNPISSEPRGEVQIGGRQVPMAAPQAGTPGASSIGGAPSTVRMIAPDGSSRDVPADQVAHYKSLGAKVAP